MVKGIIAQCPSCKAVKVPRKAWPGHFWKPCLVVWNRKKEVCDICKIKEKDATV